MAPVFRTIGGADSLACSCTFPFCVLSKLIHGFLHVVTWICQIWCMDSSWGQLALIHLLLLLLFLAHGSRWDVEIFFCSWRLNWILVVTRPVTEAGALFRTFILMQIKGHFCTRPWRNSNPVLHSKELLSLAKNNFTLDSMFLRRNTKCCNEQLTFKDVSLLELLWRRPERESAYQLRAEIRVIEIFYNRLPLPSLFSNHSKMWDIFTWWYFGRSFSPPPSPRSWQWQNIFLSLKGYWNNSRRKMP